MDKKIIGCTGPSIFQPQIKDTIENYFGAANLFLNHDNHDELEYFLSLCSGVILAGGNDIFSGTLGQQVTRGDNYSKFDIKRDKRELFIIDYCFSHNVPILAICRGFQLLLAKTFNLGLMPDISYSEILHSTSSEDIKLNYEQGEYLHTVNFINEFNGIKIDERLPCVSHHHQSVYFNKTFYNQGGYKELGLNILGIADLSISKKKNESIIELVDGVNHRFVAGQMHPEVDWSFGSRLSLAVLDAFKNMIGS